MQLGRSPAFGFSVTVLCPYGWPAVIKNDPFSREGKPNPNIYYLTCPFLRKIAARLENAGQIANFEARVATEAALREDLEAAQRRHRQEWSQAAAAFTGSTETKRPAAPPNMAAAKDELKIKCLHAHFAWYLTHPDYQLGQMLAQELDSPWCTDKRCLAMAAA